MGKYLNKDRKHFASFLTASIFVFTFFVLVFLINVPTAQAAACTFTAAAAGNWSAAATWAPGGVGTACSTYPGQTFSGDTVISNGGKYAVTMDVSPAQPINSLAITGPGSSGTTEIAVGTQTLTITNGLTITGGGNSNKIALLSISTGTITVGGDVSFGGTAAAAQLTFTGAGTLNIGGSTGMSTVGTLTTFAGSTVNYNRAGAQTSIGPYGYANLTLSGSGAKTFPAGTTTVSGVLSMEGTATATVTGTLTPGAASTLQYKGSAAQTTDGEFISPWPGSGGVKICNASGVTLGAARSVGANPFTIGSTVPNSVFNDGGYQLTATGTLNLTSGTFKLGSAGTATTWPAFGTNNISVGTTVEYAAGVAQTVSGTPTYSNLTISGAATKTAGASLTVNGTLTVSASGDTLDMTAAYTLGGTLLTITNNGTIKTSVPTATSATPLPTGKTWGGTGTVNYAAATAQTVMQGSYSGNLTFSGAGAKTTQTGTITVGGNWDITGGTATLNTNNTNMTVTGNITGTGNITSGSGTISVAGNCTNNGTFTPDSGTFTYSKTTGGQTVCGFSINGYNNLTLSNTSGTDTAGNNIAVVGALTTAASGIFDMSTYALSGTLTNITNNGTIKTQNTSAAPLTTGKTWGGTVEYNAASGSQKVMAGTYGILTLSNTSGTDTASNAVTATTLNISNASAILDMVTYDLSVTNVTNNGTIKTQSTSATPLTAGKTWGGTVNYNAASGIQTVASGSYNNLTATASSARTLKFSTSSTTTVTGTWTVTGSSGQLITLTSVSTPTQWTINPTNASVSYVDVSYSNNTGTSFCAAYSQSTNDNNTNWSIGSGASCNTAPTFSGNPTDNPDPVIAGYNVTFSGTANDSQSDNWYLAVCKTNSINVGTPPTCASSQTLCVSGSAVSSGSQNTCTWTSSGSGAQSWYAFACDNNANPLCSSSNSVNSPVTVNAVAVSVTVSPTTTDYGVMPVSQVKKAPTVNANNDFIVTNAGNVPEDFDVVGSDATGGTGWTLSTTSVGSNIFMHAYSALKTLAASFTLGSVGQQATNWVALDKASNYRALASNIAVSGTADLILELLTPSSVGDYVQKSTTITVRATQH